MKAVRSCFAALLDPRADYARHDPCEVLFIALAATDRILSRPGIPSETVRHQIHIKISVAAPSELRSCRKQDRRCHRRCYRSCRHSGDVCRSRADWTVRSRP